MEKDFRKSLKIKGFNDELQAFCHELPVLVPGLSLMQGANCLDQGVGQGGDLAGRGAHAVQRA
jgi:hypothetical protein